MERKVVVVTGGSAGVGRATARRFGARGDAVALLARGADGLHAAAAEIERAGGTALPIQADVADANAVESAADRIERELGAIDVWVNNAMTSVLAPVLQISPEEFRRVTEVTYLGVVYGTMSALRRMTPRDHGTIVQVGSALAYRAVPLQSAYCGAKHAIQGFTESLYSELRHDRSGVRITMVQLPALNTPQFEWVRSRLPNKPQPVPPIFDPDVAARAIEWAAEHPGREYHVGASALVTAEANKVVPGLLDRYLARTGYRSQQTGEPADPNRRDNLFEPLPGDHGARGPFEERAKGFSFQWWATEHRRLLQAAAAAAVAVAAAVSARNGSRAEPPDRAPA